MIKNAIIAVFVSGFLGGALMGEEKATFAGGCFWCVEAALEKVKGVREVISGYAGGDEQNPSYAEVSSGSTGHVEAIQVSYDPDSVTYEELLDAFWRQIDPTDTGGQFVDRGKQYTTAIFYHDDAQKKAAEESKRELAESGRFDKPIVTEIRPLTTFFAAEDYHQDYYKENPLRYKWYRYNSGRDQFIDKHWAKEDEELDLEQRLTPLQYEVTQNEGTEPAFNNEYWDNKREGIYVDVVSGEPLFSSKHKYASGTGWPSFYQPLVTDNIVERSDYKLFYQRTEVRSKGGDSHLGHLFNDGPQPTGQRYCINSAALRFIPKEDLEKEGYGEFRSHFED